MLTNFKVFHNEVVGLDNKIFKSKLMQGKFRLKYNLV